MTEQDALAFADSWAAAWNRIDIEVQVAHFAMNGEVRSPLAVELTGQSLVRGRDAIRQYWTQAYGGITSAPNLTLEAASWDVGLNRLNVWWRTEMPDGVTRGSELMDFGPDGLISRCEVYYGAGS